MVAKAIADKMVQLRAQKQCLCRFCNHQNEKKSEVFDTLQENQRRYQAGWMVSLASKPLKSMTVKQKTGIRLAAFRPERGQRRHYQIEKATIRDSYEEGRIQGVASTT